MTPAELQERTLVFALAAYRLVHPLLRQPEALHVAQQLLRCSAAMASNYRAACLARSEKEWTSKLGVVHEEADESVFWLVFMRRAGIAAGRSQIDVLLDEARQLARIFGAAYRTSSGRPVREPAGAPSEARPRPPQIDR